MPKKYPKYKPSNIPWIGDIPEHWDINRVKYFAYLKGRIGFHGLKSSEFIDEGPYLVTGTDFENGKVNWNNCYHITAERFWEDTHIHLKNGDLLITKDGTIGKTAIVENKPLKATLNSGILLVRPNDKVVTTSYLYHSINSEIFNRQIEFEKKGTTINHLYQETFENFYFVTPPTSEQLQISVYLDNKTQKIDKLIANKQKQIELLKEERQAIINNAVTGRLTSHSDPDLSGEESRDVVGGEAVAGVGNGIDVAIGSGIGKAAVGGNVADATAAKAAAHAAAKAAAEAATRKLKYKDSGIPWIGDIPEHWKTIALKHIVSNDSNSIVDGPFGSSINVSLDYVEHGIPVIRTINITDDGFNESNLKFMRVEKFNELNRHSVKPFDILFSKVGTIGNVCLFPTNLEKGILSTTGSCKITIDDTLADVHYFVFLLQSLKSYFLYVATANVQPFLNMDTIKNITLILPPLSEQREITLYIYKELERIQQISSILDQEILLLQEYRTALISEVVTGKIDVREELVA